MKTKGSIYILLVIGVLCLVSYFLHTPKGISDLENRTLMTFDMALINPPEENSIVYKATASERFEDALKDQFFGRDWISINYADYTASIENAYNNFWRAVIKPFKPGESQVIPKLAEIKTDYDRWPGYGLPRLEIFPYHEYSMDKVGSLFRFNNTDYMFEGPVFVGPDISELESHAAQIEHIHELYPDIRIYSYFVSPLSCTKWFDGQVGYDSPDYFEQIAQALPEYVKVKRLIYPDGAGYEKMFYKSDHHWSYKGFMQGYEDIYSMLSEDYSDISPIKKPIKIWNYSNLYGVEYRGSLAFVLQNLYDGYDEFIVPEYDLGNRKCYVIDMETGEEKPDTLCMWDSYKTGKISTDKYYDHYIHFYCSSNSFDENENYIENEYYLIRNEGSNTGHNLLLVSDSTGRAIRDVLGTHFDTEVYLDYRVMPYVKVDEIIDKYSIDTVVMNGLGSVWTQKEHSFHFTDGFAD